ncbi:MAG: YHS domain-containing protein [Candidatus Aminicenantaceae bacterium]
MKHRSTILTLAILIAFVGVLSLTTSVQAEDLVKCAVSGKEMKKSEAKGSMEYMGKTYFFCCDSCETQFKADPEKFINAEPGSLHEHGEHAEPAEHADHAEHAENGKVKDPVCGMEFDKSKAKATYEYEGKTYYFCMEKCKEDFAKNPAKYVSADENSLKCPVSGETFNKSEDTDSIEYEGKTYYFCCAGCKEKFEQDPEKYTKKK